jgi:hypothetical protein
MITMEGKFDEITEHLTARYVSGCEAIWWVFKFSLHEEVPNVIQLAVQLLGQQSVTFNPQAPPAQVLEQAANRATTLTAFFKAVQKYEVART